MGEGHLCRTEHLEEAETLRWLFAFKPGSKPTAVKSLGKKLPSPPILEEPDEVPDNFSGESSTLETVKQESSLSTCPLIADEDGDMAVIEEVRLEDPKVRSQDLMFSFSMAVWAKSCTFTRLPAIVFIIHL